MEISKKSKWSYAVGCLGRDMMFILVSMFTLAYIQYTMQLTIAQFTVISAIMILARVWDAVNDPMMGIIIENTHFKSGKFRPFILMGGLFNAAITILLFSLRPSGWLFVFFFGIVYISWGMTFTMNDIAYWSLLPNLSKNNEDRNNLTNLVVVFASLGQFLAGGLIPVIVTGNAILMYRLIGVGISLIFLGFTLLTYFGVTENPVIPNREKVTLVKMFRILTRNHQVVVMTIAILLHTIASELFVAFALNFFYFEFGYGGVQLTIFTVFFGLGTITALSTFPLLSKYMNRISILTLGIAVAVIGYILFLTIGYVLPFNEVLLYMAAFMIFFGHSMTFLIIVILTANTIEYNQVITGERNEAIIFSVRPFMTKLGAAVQQFILTLVLILSGIYTYSQKIAVLEIDKAKGILTDIAEEANSILLLATPKMLFILRLGMGLIPMLCLIGSYVLIKRKYIITEEKYDELLMMIEKKVGNG
ncbi:MAG: MFS transporter [Clostridia bacterium]|nr:MFS transporter [Clostridia bacterium]